MNPLTMASQSLFRPTTALSLVLFVAPSLALFSGVSVTPSFVLVALTLIAWKRPSLRCSPASLATWLAGAALVWALLSCLWTTAPPFQGLRTIVTTSLLATFGLMAIAAVGRLTAEERQNIAHALILGCSLTAVLLLIEINSDYVLVQKISLLQNAEKLANPQAQESRGAVVLLMLLWPTLGMCLKWGMRALLPVAFAVAVALVGLNKYASVLALATGAVTFLLVFALRNWGLLLVRLGMVAVVLGMPLIGHALPSQEDLERGTLFNSARHRVIIWQYSLDRWAEHPLRGWGMDASRAMPGGEGETVIAVQGARHHYQYLPLHPHNGPLQIWLELGLPGALFLASAAWAMTGRLSRASLSRPHLALAAAAMVAGLLIGTISYGIWQSWWQSTLWLTALLFTVSAAATRPEIKP